MPKYPHPFASITARPAHAGHLARALCGGAILAALGLLGACGGSDEAADTAPAPLIDAVTGEEVEVPENFSLNLDGGADDGATPDPDEASADGNDGPDTPAEPADDGAPADGGAPPGDAPEREAPADPPDADGTEHPLEQVVIDTVVSDPDAAPVLDEAASLACANTEFALDALIDGSPDGADRMATAAEWAADSGYEPIRAFADQLADAPDGAGADDLVVAVLETCAAAGYEL